MTEPSEAAMAKMERMQTRIDAWDEVARFIQQVSDAAKEAVVYLPPRGAGRSWEALQPFILPEPDPLLGVVEEAIAGTAEKGAVQLREALAKRGLKIVKDDT